MAGVEVQIGANTEELDAAVKRSRSQLGQLGAEMKTGITTAAKYGAAAAAAGAAIAVGLTVKGLAAVDAQAKLASQLNTTSASMATIARAGELSGISMEKINASATRLTRRLSLAEAGTGPAADALKRLGLNAAEVAQLPLDERIAKVNSAINTMIPAAEQAGVATQLFGEEAGIAMRTLDSEVLAQAAREAKVLGTSISEFDAAQIERANDAMSTIGTAVEGVSKQFAIQLAPIIEGIGNLFFETAEEAGGIGEATSDAFGFVVEASAQVINAVDGIKRVFEVVADGIIFAWNEMASKITGVFQSVLEAVSNDVVPGMDFSETIKSLEDFSVQAGSIADIAGQNIQQTLMGQMAGDQFKEFIATQKEASAKAKEEFKAEGLQVPDILYGTPEENEERAEQELERQEARNELMLKRQQGYEQIVEGLREQEAKDKEEKDKRKERAEKDFWQNSTSLMNSGSRKMFEIGKVASLSQAVVKGYSAATNAWEAGMSVGGPAAPAIAAAYTAASLARTGAQISAIRSASFGGGGGGSAGAGGGGGSVTSQINQQGQGVNAQPSETLIANLNVTGSNFDRSTVIGLVEQINELQDDGMRVRLRTS